jgi:hypothetical protein
MKCLTRYLLDEFNSTLVKYLKEQHILLELLHKILT